MDISNCGTEQRDSSLRSYQPTKVTLTKEAKTRATKKADRICVWFAGIAGASGIAHSLSLFLILSALTVAINIIARRHYMEKERKSQIELAKHAHSLDGE